MAHAALGYLAAADPTAMAAQTQAHCLQMLEQAHSMYTAARTSMLAAFTSGQGYSADADYSPRAWLETTFGGAGVLHGDLSPECASVVATVLDALSAPAGAEDTRSSQAQRFHHALQEAMRRL